MNTNRPPVVGCVVIAPVAFALVLEAERAQLHVAPARADEAAMGRSIRLLVALTALVSSSSARADEGGVSFWLPGQMGSFAAVGTEAGWSVPVLYFHAADSASASKSFIIGGRLAAGVDATADLVFVPQAGYFFPFGGSKGVVSLRVNWDFGEQNRAAGWNTFISLVLPLESAPK